MYKIACTTHICPSQKNFDKGFQVGQNSDCLHKGMLQTVDTLLHVLQKFGTKLFSALTLYNFLKGNIIS